MPSLLATTNGLHARDLINRLKSLGWTNIAVTFEDEVTPLEGNSVDTLIDELLATDEPSTLLATSPGGHEVGALVLMYDVDEKDIVIDIGSDNEAAMNEFERIDEALK
ncbi:hypothetical protein [Cobetia sp. 1AS1]|uniref:hypothetical protein n=1 Tax=Cobetia sp. 1AS1 TaxID=3040016 RepID=UPI002446CC5D|nr:hypothetical protein [Cobetia sp. 1AS1]MDH2296047.1 hypothetical protein [Cobetia sp. 1AS1]